MPLPCLRRSLSRLSRPRNLLTPEHLAVVKNEDEDDEFVCRFCWQTQDEDCGGELLAPCHCSGSVKYIHRRCLGAWQRTQRRQGAFRKSYRCDICKERYRFRRAPFSGVKLPFGRLPTGDESREVVYSVLGSPIWQVALDLWKLVILFNGGYAATSFGIRGLKAGCAQGWKHVLWYCTSMKSCGANIAVLATVFKFLQLPALLLTVGGGALTALQLVVHAIIGFYCAALYGFAHGTTQVVRATIAIALTFCHSGVGVAVSTVGRTLQRTLTLLRSVLPFLRQVGTAALMAQFK